MRRRLFVGAAAQARLVPLYQGTETPEEGLDSLSAGLLPCLPLSIVLLGMGEDMHTASLFPGADKLAEGLASDAPPILAMRAPGAPEPRVTLTAPVLSAALATHVVITGRGKRDAIERAQALSPIEAPISVVLDRATVHWAE